jgi:hypothetical protein
MSGTGNADCFSCFDCAPQSGVLPDRMVLDSRDERWFSDADEDAGAAAIHPGDYSFPLHLGKTLTGALLRFQTSCPCPCLPMLDLLATSGGSFPRASPQLKLTVAHAWNLIGTSRQLHVFILEALQGGLAASNLVR